MTPALILKLPSNLHGSEPITILGFFPNRAKSVPFHPISYLLNPFRPIFSTATWFCRSREGSDNASFEICQDLSRSKRSVVTPLGIACINIIFSHGYTYKQREYLYSFQVYESIPLITPGKQTAAHLTSYWPSGNQRFPAGAVSVQQSAFSFKYLIYLDLAAS
jgi:primosomal replication protein N